MAEKTNLEKYDQAFIKILHQKKEDLPGLRYRSIPNWDSMGHMDLIGELEEVFEISMETPDMLAFSSYEKGKEILKEYGVEIGEN